MGLDQYAFAYLPHPLSNDYTVGWYEVDKADRPEGCRVEVAYWRKHADLQGYMERLWIAKREAAGNPAQPETEGWFAGTVVFNCEPVRLTLTDLEQLETAVNRDHLPHTEGFFFGESQPEDKQATLEFIAKAREWIAKGYEIYYDSWW